MTMNIENPSLSWNQPNLWTCVEKAFPGVCVANKDTPLSPVDLKALVVLCPLYEHGSLATSGLVQPPYGIKDSRVAKKVEGYVTVLRSLNSSVQQAGGSMQLEVVFANKGVLLGRDPNLHDYDLLEYHQSQYKSYFADLCAKENITPTFNDYSSLGVDFPVYVNPEAELPTGLPEVSGTAAEQMLIKLNSFLKLLEPVVNNSKSRKKTKDIIDAITFTSAFWLIAGYLAFDYKIKQLLGKNGIYLSAERMVSLWGTAYLTPGLNDIPRIQIPA